MKVGSKWQLFVPAELAYGDRGRPGIPASSALIFEIELLSTEPAPPPGSAVSGAPLTSDIIKVPSAEEMKKRREDRSHQTRRRGKTPAVTTRSHPNSCSGFEHSSWGGVHFPMAMKWFSRSRAGFLSAFVRARWLWPPAFTSPRGARKAGPAIKVETTPVTAPPGSAPASPPSSKSGAPVSSTFTPRTLFTSGPCAIPCSPTRFSANFSAAVSGGEPRTHTPETRAWLRRHHFTGWLHFNGQSRGGWRGRNRSGHCRQQKGVHRPGGLAPTR